MESISTGLTYIAGVLGVFLVFIFIVCKLTGSGEVEKPDYSSAEAFCSALIVGFKKKAKHNKNESMLMFVVTMAGSLAAPMFVTLGGENFFLSKVVPTFLSAVVAFGTAWLQLRKPQHLWALYRGCQRKLEDNLAKYKFKVDEYSQDNACERLAVRCAEIAMEAHNEWLPIMPKGENFQSTASNNNGSNNG